MSAGLQIISDTTPDDETLGLIMYFYSLMIQGQLPVTYGFKSSTSNVVLQSIADTVYRAVVTSVGGKWFAAPPIPTTVYGLFSSHPSTFGSVPVVWDQINKRLLVRLKKPTSGTVTDSTPWTTAYSYNDTNTTTWQISINGPDATAAWVEYTQTITTVSTVVKYIPTFVLYDNGYASVTMEYYDTEHRPYAEVVYTWAKWETLEYAAWLSDHTGWFDHNEVYDETDSFQFSDVTVIPLSDPPRTGCPVRIEAMVNATRHWTYEDYSTWSPISEEMTTSSATTLYVNFPENELCDVWAYVPDKTWVKGDWYLVDMSVAFDSHTSGLYWYENYTSSWSSGWVWGASNYTSPSNYVVITPPPARTNGFPSDPVYDALVNTVTNSSASTWCDNGTTNGVTFLFSGQLDANNYLKWGRELFIGM